MYCNKKKKINYAQWSSLTGVGGGAMEKNGHIDILLSASLHLLSERLKVSAALLFAVVVELALPVHHVGGPAVELYLPLTLCLIDVV